MDDILSPEQYNAMRDLEMECNLIARHFHGQTRKCYECCFRIAAMKTQRFISLFGSTPYWQALEQFEREVGIVVEWSMFS